MSEAAVTEVRYNRFRKTTERRLVQSVTTKPQVTLHSTATVTALEREVASQRSRSGASGIGFTPALLAAIVRGVSSSRLNGTVTDQVISLHAGVNLGVAVEVNGSLVVPVIRDADRLSVARTGSELKRLADRARSGGLRREDVDGATFTVTNLGPMGVEFFTPIVNPPELAILGVGAIQERLAMVDGAIARIRTIGLSLSFDHAATDGADAARVLAAVARAVESVEDVNWIDTDGHLDELPSTTDVSN